MSLIRLHDAHLHLQNPRLRGSLEKTLAEAKLAGVDSMVINGTSPEDWNAVSELCAKQSEISLIPSYGLHPWNTPCSDDSWKAKLVELLNLQPNACIGECGLDRWMKSPNLKAQEETFRFQLELASQRNLPLSIHVLKAWGWLLEILQTSPLPARGFLLHSYGGSAETAKQLEKLGAYFSFSGYFLSEKKSAVQHAFRCISPSRILIETDAPDMLPPAPFVTHHLPEKTNHPANLANIHNGFSQVLNTPEETLSAQLAQNFQRFFIDK